MSASGIKHAKKRIGVIVIPVELDILKNHEMRRTER
ncbi:hypothetical protein HE1_00922 [Holospora elegans E1]|uniref:Uncharacterized protein n=1 Tax=Holospora elegans E1 TaxID=1427503 RepID=A0A023E0L0_9PROT|nr:hypothetical protein HE1_00922 [Holospora elegans E1]